jgi:NAD(P)-dependent dehydrogenase (short-subunit alcohol dehydrogenase family)
MSITRFSLAGKVAVVTGSGRGLGEGIAKGLAGAGAAVVTTARTASEAENTAKEIVAAGGKAVAYPIDVADPEACARLVEKTVSTFGRLDAMLCNAGVNFSNPADRATAKELEETVRINVGGAMYCAQEAAKQMMKQGGGGSIVMTSSNASLVGFPNLLTYNISKGGMDMMVRTMAIEWGPHNIRVNAFNPGYIEHSMKRPEEKKADLHEDEEIRRMTPLGRRGRVEEVVGVAIFLASDASSFITGAVLPVDGGWCAM